MKRVSQTIMVVVLVSSVWGASAFAGEGTMVVSHLHASLLSVMKDAKQLAYRGRYQQLKPVVKNSHDLSAVTRLAVGRYWGTLTREEQSRLLDTFTELSIATYASRFDGYSGETFTVVSEKPTSRGYLLVETQLIKSDGNLVQFNYLLRQTQGQWRIINIIVDGVSDLALKKAEYGSVLKARGFSGLLEMLERQIRKYADG